MSENKNKSSIVVKWPSVTNSYFTFNDIEKINKNLAAPTLRIKLVQRLETKKICEIGFMTGGRGRPRKVYANYPVTQEVMNLAEKNNIYLIEAAKKLVKIITVDNSNTNGVPMTPNIHENSTDVDTSTEHEKSACTL